MTAPIPLHHGLREVADRYDGYILDLWGVLHDGERAFPGVPEALRALKARGKWICLLSNAPRRFPGTLKRLEAMGLTPDLWHAMMTSGQAAHLALRDPPDDWHAALGPRLYHLGPPRDADVYEGLPGRIRVATPEEADFVVNTGVDDFDETVADYEPVLRRCADRRLPMVCANPDLIVHVGPKLVVCAGLLAQRYEEMGGEVRYHGKPHPPVYRRCFDLLAGLAGAPLDPARIVAIGDSLRTDVAGARAAGIDAILVTGGIHRDELDAAAGGHGDPAKLEEIAAAAPARPTGALPALVW
ncbi:TIGR01459 family HAD-type hydrolase [Rhodospirillum centenum]|uniref:HAD-superfamily hydrolase, subfamily IIA n=1 Tax=Rhodospirillum centenum (strain ATCC 51521 / SW) TaxID=414684 RepID=B6IW59_RHOCS|nr:TIGR01459 family HAD-type hydrolase [Rhodospirillum centenum]ACJ00533.1 HAD-superfamily hydrolase, subfamily IIA [Rhodospirillum centenum SW]